MAEKLISTLHCLPLPSVKDYPTAAVERGSLPTLRRGRGMDTNHTLTHTYIHTHTITYSPTEINILTNQRHAMFKPRLKYFRSQMPVHGPLT